MRSRSTGRLLLATVRAEPLILIAVAPAMLFPSSLRLLLSCAAIALVWCAAWRTTGRLVPRSPLDVALVTLGILITLSLFTTFDTRGSLGKFSGVLFGLVAYYAVIRRVRRPEDFVVASELFAAAGAALAVVALLGTNWAGKFGVVGDLVMRLPATIRGVPGAEEGFQPNAVAGSLVIFLPVQLALLVNTQRLRGRVRFALLASLLLTAVTILITQSRGALMGLAAAGFVALLLHSPKSRRVAVIVIVLGAILAGWRGLPWLADLVISRDTAGFFDAVKGRLEIWSRAIYVIRDFPLTGLGLNNFRRVMPAWYPAFLIAPDVDVAHAHSQLLQAGADLGVPGIVAYGAIWLAAAAMLARVYRGTRDRFLRSVAGGLSAGLLAQFVFGLTDAIPLGAKVGIVFWLTLGLAAALHHVWRSEESLSNAQSIT